jgi:D-aspartate ligase
MNVPVVLLGGLNVVRALGLAGIPVIIASSEGRKPSMASRYCRGVIELPPISSRDAVVEALVNAGRRLAQEHGGPVPLLYDNDDRLALVQDYRDALAPHFLFLLNEKPLADALLEKSRFQELAEQRRLPVPRSIAWDALAEERGPVLVKPRTRTGWDDSSVRLRLFGGDGKARIFDNGRKARDDALVQQLRDKLAFQEYVPGGDDAIWSFHGFAAPGGDVLEWFVGRKIRTFPALTGDSSYLRLEHNGELAALGRDIAARIGLAGIFKMDFKRSAHTGRFYLFEVNTRFNLWHYLGAAAGVNLPRIAYEYLLHGMRPAHAEARTDLRWLCMTYDWRAFREGNLGLWQWLWSLAEGAKVYDVFAWNDPLPFVHQLGRRALERVRNRIPGRRIAPPASAPR